MHDGLSQVYACRARGIFRNRQEKPPVGDRVSFDITEDRVARIIFEDSGVPYDPLAKEDPDVTLSANERQIGGLGIFMVKKTMDSVSYEYSEGKNILTLEKRL